MIQGLVGQQSGSRNLLLVVPTELPLAPVIHAWPQGYPGFQAVFFFWFHYMQTVGFSVEISWNIMRYPTIGTELHFKKWYRQLKQQTSHFGVPSARPNSIIDRRAAVQHLIRMMHYDILRSQRHRWSTEPMAILPSGYVKIAIEHGHL